MQTPVVHVFDDPDDRSRPFPWSGIAERVAHHGQLLADRIRVRPVSLSHGAVDDDHPRGLGRIPCRERASLQERNAHDREVVPDDGAMLWPDPVFAAPVDRLVAYDRSGVAVDGNNA